MGLSRRQFAKEFKLTAVRRLEQAVSIADVARALEVDPTCCTAGAGSFAMAPATRLPATGSRAGRKGASRNWSARSVNRAWGFFEGMLAAHRGAADAAGIDWKSAVYRKVQEEVKADRG